MKCLVMGRHDPSRRERCDLWGHAWSTICDNSPLSPTDHTVPYGTGFWRARSMHSMPGYHHLVPPGQTHLRPYVDAHAPTRGAIPNWRTTPTLQHSNTPTLQHSNTPTLQHSNTPTLQHSNTPTLQHSNTPSLHHSITPRGRIRGRGRRRGRGRERSASRHKMPAISIDCLTRDITGIIGGQEGDEAGDIFWPADPLHGDIVNPFLHQFSWTVIAQQLSPGLIVISPHIGINDAGTECVHGDPRWGELFG